MTAVDETHATPVAPCAPGVAQALLDVRFGREVSGRVDWDGRAAARRQRQMLDLRRSGALPQAERYGWLSLAGLLVGLTSTQMDTLDVDGVGVGARSGPRDVLPVFPVDPPAGQPAHVAGTGIDVVDPRDRLGWEILILAATGSCMLPGFDHLRASAGAVVADLRARLENISHG